MLPSMMMMLRPMSSDVSAHHGCVAVGLLTAGLLADALRAAAWLLSLTVTLSYEVDLLRRGRDIHPVTHVVAIPALKCDLTPLAVHDFQHRHRFRVAIGQLD